MRDFGTTVATLKVAEQLGGVFRGIMRYDNDSTGPTFRDHDSEGHIAEDAILGVIDWDNETVFWVDHNDTTVHRARMIGSDKMEVIVIEAGPDALATRMVLARQ